MINTQVADASILLLTVVSAWLIGNYFYRTRKSEIKKIPLLLLVFMAMWCALNMVGHLVAVIWVNIQRMQAGTFSYNLHFYNLLLMGVVFLSLSLLQLRCIKFLSRGKYYMRKPLAIFCLSLALLSFPLFPFNPIGLLPVISSLIILGTVAATKKQWQRTTHKKSRRAVSA
ncbi:hypothetical protein AAE02nite_27940 [Adhaeribacter aerolatus]|uniref:Uncharacterized protein n=1 Tax=Adhaeribacter aerolatus TaxID=670289 RepID=A0A512AZK8_9BACT|nr:hypothetical protein [Adhaeribacter aerolatus]GEO05130.1 hypothetical protein AAE02nite_27940 [Adhaeribacter aerolatus]